MKALILSCGTGGGHNAAGRAIKEELERRGDSVLMLNPYDLAGKHTAKRIDETYIKTVQAAPRVFGAVYALSLPGLFCERGYDQKAAKAF